MVVGTPIEILVGMAPGFRSSPQFAFRLLEPNFGFLPASFFILKSSTWKREF